MQTVTKECVRQSMKSRRKKREEQEKEEILTTERLMLGTDAKELRLTEAPLDVFCSFGCTPADARLFGISFQREAEVTVPLAEEASVLVPFETRRFFTSDFTETASMLFFKPSARAPLAGKERLCERVALWLRENGVLVPFRLDLSFVMLLFFEKPLVPA